MLVKTTNVALSDCFRVYSDKEKWAAFKEVDVPREELLGNLGTLIGSAFDGIFGDDGDKVKAEQNMKDLQNTGIDYMPFREARNALEEDMLGKLKGGEIIAHGHTLPRNAQDERVQIPHDVWINFPSIKWEANKVKGQGLEFINVIVSPVANDDNDAITGQESTKKQGRPSIRPFIEEAYHALNQGGQVNFSAPKSALYGPICNWLAIRYPNKKEMFKGMDDSTIRKAISKQFDKDRSNQT